MEVMGLTCDAISVPVGSLGRIWASPSVLTLEGAGPVCDDRFVALQSHSAAANKFTQNNSLFIAFVYNFTYKKQIILEFDLLNLTLVKPNVNIMEINNHSE